MIDLFFSVMDSWPHLKSDLTGLVNLELIDVSQIVYSIFDENLSVNTRSHDTFIMFVLEIITNSDPW